MGIISYKMGRNMMCVRCAYTPRTGGTPFYAVLSLLALSARRQHDDTPSIDRPCGRDHVAQSWAFISYKMGRDMMYVRCAYTPRTGSVPFCCFSHFARSIDRAMGRQQTCRTVLQSAMSPRTESKDLPRVSPGRTVFACPNGHQKSGFSASDVRSEHIAGTARTRRTT